MSGLIQSNKGQIRRRVHRDNISSANQSLTDSLSGGDAGSTQSQVEIVLKQGLELDAQETPLRKQRTVLLHLCDELANRPTVRDDDSLAEKGSALGTADVEHIRQTRKVRERDVICRRGQGIR